MSNTFIDRNLYNPDAVNKPPTICVELPLSKEEHFELSKDLVKYNLADEVIINLVGNGFKRTLVAFNARDQTAHKIAGEKSVRMLLQIPVAAVG